MVIKKEGKKAGIFDGFHIEEGDHIGSNAQQLEFAENEEQHASSAFVDDGIFSDFDLDGIVKENEEREQRDAAAAALDDNDNNNMYNSSNSDDKNKNNNKNETNNLCFQERERMIPTTSRIRMRGEEMKYYQESMKVVQVGSFD